MAPDISAVSHLVREGHDVWTVDFGAPEREDGGLERTLDLLSAPTAHGAGAPASDAQVVGHYGSAGTLKIPGTVALVGVFFVSFVLYYFINWKYLSEIWPLR